MRARCIGIFLPSGPGYYRRLVSGIGEYCRGRRDWLIVSWPSSLRRDEQAIRRSLRDRPLDGAIAGATPFWERLVRRTGLPFVNVEYNRHRTLPLVNTNDTSVGRLAAEHFHDRGIRHVAFIGDAGWFPAIARLAAFSEQVRTWNNEPVHIHECPPEMAGGRPMAKWLKALPRPVGIFAWNDERARDVHQACLNAGLRIPQDVLLLGVDNDDAVCQFLDPPLSSIDSNIERIGFEAAALLDRMMHGEATPTRPLLIEPAGVIVRSSTDALMLDDPEVLEAVRYIRQHASQSFTVQHVLDHLCISRRSLEKRFRRALGRTPLSEIHQVIINRAKELLQHTDLPIPQLARRIGCPRANHFTTLFRKQTGLTPTAFRRQVRPASFDEAGNGAA